MTLRITRRSRDGDQELGEIDSLAKLIEIDGRYDIWTIAFLVNGSHIVSGGEEGKIRCWRVEDGKEVGTPMDAGSAVGNLAVSRDGKWVVSGTISGQVAVWGAESYSKVSEFTAHRGWVRVVDISPDGTRIATGSKDRTACVWSLSTSERLLGPLQHNNSVGAVKFSPDGRNLATATWWRDSVRIYDSQNGDRLIDVPINVNSALNQSLAWENDKRLFALACDGNITCLDTSTGTPLSQWRIHSDKQARCIAIASNGTFIVASSESSFSFWDIKTHKQIGPVVEHMPLVASMAISPNNNIATGGGKKIRLQDIYDLIPLAYHDDVFPERALRPTIVKRADRGETGELPFPRREDQTDERIANLEKTVLDLRHKLATTQHIADQKEAGLNETINTLREDLRARDENSNNTITDFEQTVQRLREELTNSQRNVGTLRHILHAHEQKHQCEILYAEGRIVDAAAALRELVCTIGDRARANKLITDWLAEFTLRCVSALENTGDRASSVKKYNEALEAYSAALSISNSPPNTLLVKWARIILTSEPAEKGLRATGEFKCPKFDIYRVICEILDGDGRIKEAIECFQQMQVELGDEANTHDERAQWELEFRRQCAEKLEELADGAMESQNYNEAIEKLSTMLLLDPADRIGIFIKRSQAQAQMKSWEEALRDADTVVELDPSSPRGYERRHAILHDMKRYAEAAKTFHVMLSKLDKSPDEHVQKRRLLYVDATTTIRNVVKQAIRHMPRVLIDTTNGRLHDKEQQAAAFEELPIYSELVSSMTTQLDHARIYKEVKNFYRYVMLSHRWEHDEPLLQKVANISVYDLQPSPANVKLQTFCSLVRSLGFRWAWSDTSCVDKLNNVVLQESLVAMFTWYRASSLTIVYLRGVSSKSGVPGGLQGSVWNTRGWTYQEYVAAETVQFYTEDWKPYLGLTLFNHKKSVDIVSEMELATGVSAQQMAVLRPGLDRVREKLFLASKRQTTLVEDAAYSLFGIFNAAIPAIYGEGNRAVGRFLEHILTGSGDVTILAWSGSAGSYNSCLPTDITVYQQLVPPHIPLPIEVTEMNTMVAGLRLSLTEHSLALAVQLHSRLNELPGPALAASRLRLPGIVFRLAKLVCVSGPDPLTNLYFYRATSSALEEIEIRTVDHLTGTTDVCLVHPWIRPLLDQEFLAGAALLDRTTQALRFVVRLCQPFGALLFEPVSRVEYRRVAADGLIMVRVREGVELAELMEGVRTIEVQ